MSSPTVHGSLEGNLIFAPHYLSDRTDMHFDIHGYDTREAGSMNVYFPTVHKEIYRNSFFFWW